MRTRKAEKAKARIVIPGYQHSEVMDVKVSSPTLSRLEDIRILQWTALNPCIVEMCRCKVRVLARRRTGYARL